MKQKKGQAALEFLMTYGWAILVVLVVISALAYFGVLNPDALVPDKCTLVTGISCDDYIVTDSDVKLKFGNGLGKPIYVTNVTIAVPSGSTNKKGCRLGIAYPGTLINNGGSSTFTLSNDLNASHTCTGISTVGRKPRFNLAITYYFADSDRSFNHTATGELMAKVQ